ncbi:MAG: Ig-like domain-containing protein [Nitrospira sp.]|nr:Ig-like domain-containing protein [Nitrospira sp.]
MTYTQADGAFTSTAGTFTVSGAWTHTAGGTFTHNSGTVSFTGATAAYNGNDSFFNLTIAKNNGSSFNMTAGNTVQVSGLLTHTDGILNTGTLEILGANVQVGTLADGGSATLLFQVAGDQTVTSGGSNAATCGFALNKASGKVSLPGGANLSINSLAINNATSTFESTSGILIVRGAWANTTGGTFTANGGTVSFTGASATYNGNDTFFNLTIAKNNGSGFNMTAGNTAIATGLLTHTDGNINTGTIEARGNVVVSSTADGDTGTISFLVGTDQTITGNGGLTCSLNIAKSGGTLDAGATNLSVRALTLAATGGGFRSTSGTLSIRVSATISAGAVFNHNAGTIATTTSTSKTLQFGDAVLNSLTLGGGANTSFVGTNTVAGNLLITSINNLSGGTISVSGNVTTQVSSSSTPLSTIINFNGTGDQVFGSGGLAGGRIIPGVRIDKPSGILFIQDTLNVSSDWTYVQGPVSAGTSTIRFAISSIINGGASAGPKMTFGNVVFNCGGNTTIAAGSEMHIGGSFDIIATNAITGPPIYCAGDISTERATGSTYTGSIILEGSGNQTITQARATGAITVSSKQRTSNVATLVTASPHGLIKNQLVTITLSPADVAFDGGRRVLSVVDSTTFTFTSNGADIASSATGGTSTGSAGLFPSGGFTISKTGGIARAQTPLSFSTSSAMPLTVSTGTLDLNGFNLTMGATGPINVNNGGNFQFQGLETITKAASPANAPTLNVGSTVTYTGNGDGLADSIGVRGFSYKNLAINSVDGNDTFTLSGALSITENLILSGGTLDVTTPSNHAVTIGGNWSISGSGAFNARNGTVTFNDSTRISTISGSTVFNNLLCITPSKTLKFQTGTTQTVNGTFQVDGAAAGSLISLLSATDGAQWSIAPAVAGRSVQFVQVRDSVNTVLPKIAPANSTDMGNNINWFNQVPVATNDNYTMLEDAVLSEPAVSGVLANDTNPNGTGLTAIFVAGGGPNNGSALLSSDGSFTFTPSGDFNGSDTFTYKTNDTIFDSNTATVTITVTAVNDPPSFTKGVDVTVLEDASPQTIANWATAISAGPANEAGQTMSFTVTGNTNPGLFSSGPAIAPDGTLTFTSGADANGTATITLVLVDNGGVLHGGMDTSAAQTFDITVTAVNDTPAFTKGSDVTVLEDTGPQTIANWATAISVGPANEAGQTVSFSVTGNTNPSLFVSGPAVASDGTLTFTTATNANGTATVTIVLADNGGVLNGGADTSSPQTFLITVLASDDPTIAVDDAFSTDEDTLLVVAVPGVLGNDIEVDNDPLIVSLVLGSGPSNGTLTLNPDGSLNYLPSLNFNGTDTFRYIVNDGVSDSTPATVSITVNAIDDAPVAEDDSYVTTVNTPLNVPSNGVLTNDSDVENDPLTANLVIASGPVNGALFLNLNGSFSYIPNPGFVGSDSFSYFANDGTLDSNVALVSIQVNNPVVPNGSAVPPVIVLGDQTALSSSPTGGTGVYVNFDWSGPGFSSNVQNPGSVSPPSLGANDYTVTVTDSAGFTGSETITVFVIASELQANPAVTATVGGTTTTGASAVIFVGDSVALSSEPTGGSGIYETFSWTGPGFSSSTQNPGAVVPPGPGTHLYSLTVTDSFGLTSTQSVTVVASESVADQGIYLKKGWVRYRAFRDSSLTSPNDSFTLTVEGHRWVTAYLSQSTGT